VASPGALLLTVPLCSDVESKRRDKRKEKMRVIDLFLSLSAISVAGTKEKSSH